jgi:chaperonin GroES
VFRKVCWNKGAGRPSSELILPTDLIINYWATDWARARKTHVFPKTRNEIIEKMRSGEYMEIDLPKEAALPKQRGSKDIKQSPSEATNVSVARDVPFTIYESEDWADLDEDGYAEPYIFTILAETQEVLNILPRFDEGRVETRDKGGKEQVTRITPYEYIINYKFLPDIDSSIYGAGFGKLIGPTGAAVDSLINQLIDAGTLATMPAGFYSRGVKLRRGGKLRLKPGQWEKVNSTGEDLARGFFTIPTKEPSATLFQLLGMLIAAGEQVGSSTQTMKGENPGQNTPYKSMAEMQESGMQVFLGIYKRVYRSLTREYRMMQLLNFMYLDPQDYRELLDDEETPVPEQPQGAPPGAAGPQGPPGSPQGPPPVLRPPPSIADFDPTGIDIVPEADPNLQNSWRKKARTQQLIEARNAGMPLNDKYITKLFLEAIDEPEPEKAMQMEPPPPTSDELNHQAKMRELDIKETEVALSGLLRQHEPMVSMARAMEFVAKARALGNEADMKEFEASLKMMELEMKDVMEQHRAIRDSFLMDKKIEVEDAKISAHRARTRNIIEKSAQKPVSGRD